VNNDLGAVQLGTFSVAACMAHCFSTYPAAMGGVLLTGSNLCYCKGAMIGAATPQGTRCAVLL
jgi:hexokinase